MCKVMLKIVALFTFIATITACGTNPVTGKSELTLMSPQQEVALGTQQYPPSKQSQGGAYIVDRSVNDYVSVSVINWRAKALKPICPMNLS
jgi:predicted Zn-dependent protease